MSELHRIKIKRGEVEIEIESTEKNYLNSKLNELLEYNFGKEKVKDHTPPSKPATPRSHKSSKKKESKEKKEEQLDISGLVNHIKEQDEYKHIEKNVLDKRDRLPKILMCFYYAEKYLDTPYLTTGNVELITDQFSAKVKTSNVSTTIKDNLKYFSQDQVRKQGALIRYKLNRTGTQEFEKFKKDGGVKS
ncbi:MAG: hypothetical protein MUO34_07265 [Ignavibacteriaceae bacterium]|nr:hypothetical protein [Ignavibacteriaceae bacterium]